METQRKQRKQRKRLGMSEGIALKRAGSRRAPKRKGNDALAPILPSSQHQPGEQRMNEAQKRALENLFRGSSSIITCRNLLAGRLFSVGIQLERDGESIELTKEFARHLNSEWMTFARAVLDSFLTWGMCVVALEQPPDTTLFGKQTSKKRPREPLVPIVPPPDTYEVSFLAGGRVGYLRSYKVYAAAPHHATEADPEAHVFVCEPPTPEGDFCSPTASVFGLASFVDSLQDLALQAELVNVRPRVWAQPRKEDTSKGIADSSLFFDTTSRNLQTEQDGDDSKAKAALLAAQVKLCEAINQYQTRGSGPEYIGFGKQPDPPRRQEVPPGVFTLPVGLDMVNNSTGVASPRNDLESLVRLSNESAAAAFGVPLEMLSGGSFRASSNQQLMLLNSTITTWSRCVNEVLAAAYNAIYNDNAEISLIVNPLVSTDEIINLHSSGLMPRALAMSAALGDVASAAAVRDAVAEAEKEEVEKKKLEDEKAKLEMEASQLANDKSRIDITAAKAGDASSGSENGKSTPNSPA
jgi:cell division protein FtsL